MKKLIIFIFFILIITSLSAKAQETDTTSVWGENSSVFNKGFDNQKPVTDSKLKETIKQIKERNLSKKQRKIREEVQPLSPMSDFEHLKNFAQDSDEDNQLNNTHTVMIPARAYSMDGQIITPGYYKLSCRKVAKNEYMLELSQGTKVIMSVKAEQTEQDLEQDSISFCDAEIISNNRIRLMYGSLDLNLVGYLYIEN